MPLGLTLRGAAESATASTVLLATLAPELQAPLPHPSTPQLGYRSLRELPLLLLLLLLLLLRLLKPRSLAAITGGQFGFLAMRTHGNEAPA